MLPQMGVFFMSSNIKKVMPAASEASISPARIKKSVAEYLTRNMAVATLILLTVVGIRTAATPGGESLLTSLQNAVQSEWDENLGRLSYVSRSIGESVQVFSGQTGAVELISPPARSQQTPFQLVSRICAIRTRAISTPSAPEKSAQSRTMTQGDISCAFCTTAASWRAYTTALYAVMCRKAVKLPRKPAWGAPRRILPFSYIGRAKR